MVIGIAALGQGDADFGRNFEFREGESVIFVIVGGASLAFYALIGFEDSVNVAEETQDPARVFPRALFTRPRRWPVSIYLLVTLTAVDGGAHRTIWPARTARCSRWCARARWTSRSSCSPASPCWPWPTAL